MEPVKKKRRSGGGGVKTEPGMKSEGGPDIPHHVKQILNWQLDCQPVKQSFR